MSRVDDANAIDLIFEKIIEEKIRLHQMLWSPNLTQSSQIISQSKKFIDSLDALKSVLKIIGR